MEVSPEPSVPSRENVYHLSAVCRGAEGRFQLLLSLLVQLGETLRPEGGARQSLAEDGVDRGGLEPATRTARQLWRTDAAQFNRKWTHL